MRAIALIPLLSCGLLVACGGGGSSDDGDNTQASVFAGNDLQIIEKTDFTITAKGSPTEGTFTWQRVSGPIVDGFPLDGAVQTITAPDVKADSELVLRVSYQTTGGGLVHDDISIFITSNNQLPQAVITQTAPQVLPSVYNDTVTLSAADSTDPDTNGQINSYLWQLISGPALNINSFTRAC